MSTPRAFRLNPRQRRAFVSYLFALTAAASVITVSASDVLPCPARPTKARFADGGGEKMREGGKTIVEKRPRRWIEEKKPSVPSAQ
ncbi:hypothetical protein K474DRAFT_1639092 [Panus rudis PR-1116 ss-1]|nr:hypothetical protein K474DRAFT_1639092 [Panus rudis PR-1116 ss-1]